MAVLIGHKKISKLLLGGNQVKDVFAENRQLYPNSEYTI